jgi:hypothetical protein
MTRIQWLMRNVYSKRIVSNISLLHAKLLFSFLIFCHNPNDFNVKRLPIKLSLLYFTLYNLKA